MDSEFLSFRKNTIGIDMAFDGPYGQKKIIYADWIASGRLYRPIEKSISEKIGPWVGNTHTETSTTGTLMTHAYHHAKNIIKNHVNAYDTDVFLATGYGMTAAINKLQRILGLKYCTLLKGHGCLKEVERPVVLISHMEHHSNQTSWFETIADVVVVPPGRDLLFDLNKLEKELKKYKNRKTIIGSFTAASNVTGIETPIHQIASLMHKYGGVCFADYAASAPYVELNMHPFAKDEYLDGIFFSPHKFLGGPGSSGVLIFNSNLYHNVSPDQPGGGTVEWTNPWGEHRYIDDIETREDGGTPGFLQTIKAAMAIRLKEKMGVIMMRKQEELLMERLFSGFQSIAGLNILAEKHHERLGVMSFYIRDIHYNLVVRLLNDHFGIQVRGGCACAGTYGHYLLDVTKNKSKSITDLISRGDLSQKPGWVRASIHPTSTVAEIDSIVEGVRHIAKNHKKLARDYDYDRHTNEFYHKNDKKKETEIARDWFWF